ncbi:SusC/RagA family TonB-linked outer membrane protein [Aestuariibaculum sediminum]|uniref:SusC/RagA family TonB-linked outer membrane protein n=1 Tax=Aestuariibaculum sediminum TaxID=2770637 RepID=A0A8J6Q223_9FLAO|nr:SusC/RagA family TonB-linked outer membrane protein [Aestuariibaculum sediminum]MBD0831505.1 SusC/RagA family TonB-linked outer membrane protein [Aestuariibaculum sediminum]
MKNLPLGIRKWRIFFTYLTLCIPLFTLLLSVAPQIQNLTVTGRITDNTGMPLAGVHVKSVYTKKGVVTDFDGAYQIGVSPVDSLVFTAIGYKSQTKAVNNQEIINVALIEDITELGTVMINAGYYNVSERERTGNISRITSKDIETQPVTNPLAAMQGQMSGVNITQTTGVPGAGYDIEIRGKNFINGTTNPLFIVDGIPYSGQSLESAYLSANINQGNVSPLNFINPQDIESIEVLKDADATAIYGSRGANGVVLITTKRGKIGKTKFDIGFNTSFGKVTRFRALMNTEQYLEVRKEAVINDNFESYYNNPSLDYFWPDLKIWDQTRYTDWQQVLLGKTSTRNNLQFAVSGGSEQTQFNISGSHLKETTVFPGDANYNKTTVYSALNHGSIDGKFNLNFTTSLSLEDNDLPYADFTLLANTLEPNAPSLFTDKGELNWENSTWKNPLAALDRQYNMKSNTILSSALVSYEVLENLEVKTSLGYSKYDLTSYATYPSSSLDPNLGYGAEYSTTSTNQSSRDSWIIEPQINWSQELGNLKLSVLLGATYQQQKEKQFVIRGSDFPNNNLILTLSAANNLLIVTDTNSEYNYAAYFGRFNLNFKSKYILNVTGRRDGSSRFGPGKQFGNFGALGGAWIFSEEGMLKNSSWLSFGKLRGSYGTTGSDNIGDYKYLGTYDITGNYYDDTLVIEPSGVYNPNFGWEVNKKLEVGLELGMFDNRLNVQLAHYQNRSSNQLIGIPLAATTGFSSLTGNFNATVENKGLEFDINSLNIKTSSFQWKSSLNLTIPKNRLVAFPDLESSTFANKYIVGEPLTMIRLYHAFGVDPSTGIYQFEDYNADGKITSTDDKQWIEDSAPDFYGGFSNAISYKNFTLDFLCQFKKQKGYNSLAIDALAGFKRNGPVELYQRWLEQGDNSLVQKATMGGMPALSIAGQSQSQSNAAFTDASFIRLRNVLLNYKLPTSVIKGVDLNLFLQGQNLVTITNYMGADPEQTSNSKLPPLRQITLGAQLNF